MQGHLIAQGVPMERSSTSRSFSTHQLFRWNKEKIDETIHFATINLTWF
jgi:hypothetical protein